MVLGRNGDAARCHVPYRMISTSMPELEFSCLGADRPGQELMSQTNPEIRNLLPQHAGDQLESGVEICWVAGSGRYHDPVRLKPLDLFSRRAEWNDGHPTAPLNQRSNDVSLDSAVKNHNVRP